MAMGWTWSHIDREVTIPILKEIFETWHHRPPVHRMVAAYLGIKQEIAVIPTQEELEAAVMNFRG